MFERFTELVRADDLLAARILRDHDADPEKVRNAVIRTLSGEAQREHPQAALDEVELTSPPLAREVLAELERLGRETQAALDRQAFDEASLRDEERRRVHVAAARLVLAWQRQRHGA